ncbi:MAG: energy transducer TonB [Pedobacter sp.]|nr:MAG: energy transducer TonB [Pedobacter sp.]
MRNLFLIGLVATLLFASCQNEAKKETQSIDTIGTPPEPTKDSLTKDTLIPPPPPKAANDGDALDFLAMDNPPKYPGGVNEFYKFLGQNLKYPAVAAAENIQGNVFVSFTIEKDGSLTDIKVDRKLGGGTDEEAMRVLKLSKKWIPGTQDGKPMRVKYKMPIKFVLAN